MKTSILIAAHNSLGLLLSYLPHNLRLLEADQEILILDLCSQDNTAEYLVRNNEEVKIAMKTGLVRVFKCAGDIQVNPAQGFNALSKHAKGSILTFLSANQFIPHPEIYDHVRDGIVARPKFSIGAAVLGVLKLSITANEFKKQNGFYENYGTFDFLMADCLSLPSYRYSDSRPAKVRLPTTLGDISADVSHFFTLNKLGLPRLNTDMGNARIYEVGVPTDSV